MKKIIICLIMVGVVLLVGCNESKVHTKETTTSTTQNLTITTDVNRANIEFITDKNKSLKSKAISHNRAKQIYSFVNRERMKSSLNDSGVLKNFSNMFGAAEFRKVKGDTEVGELSYCKFVDSSTKEKYFVFFNGSKNNSCLVDMLLLDKNNKFVKVTYPDDNYDYNFKKGMKYISKIDLQ